MKKIILIVLMFASILGALDFLMPDEAFKPVVTVGANETIDVRLDLGKDIYVYSDKFGIALKEGSGLSIASMVVKNHSENHDGDDVYVDDVIATVTLAKDAGVSGDVGVTLLLDYQGCSNMGLCYEPTQKPFELSINSDLLGTPNASSTDAEVASSSSDTFGVTETDAILDVLKGGSFFSILAIFFGIGVVLSLTPCIFPMIPILSSIIVSQGEDISAKKGFMLSLVYVLSMAVAYSIAGVLAGIFGENLQIVLQNPWAIGGFSLVFVALAFSMFGYYEIGLPASWQSKLTSASDDASSKGGFISVAVMGFLSALIVGPCVAPGLAGALLYIGQTGDAFLGGAALFVMSIGMGLPLLLIGVGAGKFMPRPGGWMDTLTHVFGAVMLAIAIWMLSRIIDDSVTMALWAIFFIASGVYMKAFESVAQRARSFAIVKSLGLLSFIYGVMLFIGLLSGSTSMMTPLEKFTSAGSVSVVVEEEASLFQVIHSSAELDALLEANRDKTVMLDFSAEWCSSCKEMEHITFADAGVKAKMSELVLIQADVTANTAQEKALTKRFGLFGPPGILFFKEAKEIKNARIIGYTPPEKFLAHLNKL